MRHSGCSSSVTVNKSHLLTSARPRASVGRNFRYFSARYSTIAADSVSTRSPSTSTGILAAGLSFRNSGRDPSPANRFTLIGSKSTPNSCSVQRARIERVKANSYSFMKLSVQVKAFAKGALAVRAKVDGARGSVANGPAELDEARKQRCTDGTHQVMPPLAPVHADSAGRAFLAANQACVDAEIADQALAGRTEYDGRVVEIECLPLQQARIRKHTELARE